MQPTQPALSKPYEYPLLDHEKTPEFQKWKAERLAETQKYMKEAWGFGEEATSLEKLVLLRDGLGFPDPIRRAAAHKIQVANQVFRRDENGIPKETYSVWRSLD